MFVNRTYLSDQGSDGAGWGPADTPGPGAGLPTYSGTLADGTKLVAAEVVKQFGRPMPAPKPPVSAEQWEQLVHAKTNDPALEPGHRAGAQGAEVGEVLEHPVLDPRLVQDARGARQDPVRRRDRRRRRPRRPSTCWCSCRASSARCT